MRACTVVVFDTETTSFSVYREHIVQIAATVWRFDPLPESLVKLKPHVSECFSHWDTTTEFVSRKLCKLVLSFLHVTLRECDNNMNESDSSSSSESSFNSYVRTQKPMHPKAQEATGIVERDIATAPGHFRDVCVRWLRWLRECRRSPDESIVLVAHNGTRFDMPILLQEMERHRVHWRCLEQAGVTHAFDSLEFLKARQFARDPDTGRALPSFKLGPLYRACFPRARAFKEHDALEDTRALARILSKIDSWSQGRWFTHAYSMPSLFAKFRSQRGERVPSSVDRVAHRPTFAPSTAIIVELGDDSRAAQTNAATIHGSEGSQQGRGNQGSVPVAVAANFGTVTPTHPNGCRSGASGGSRGTLASFGFAPVERARINAVNAASGVAPSPLLVPIIPPTPPIAPSPSVRHMRKPVSLSDDLAPSQTSSMVECVQCHSRVSTYFSHSCGDTVMREQDE